MDTPMAHAGLSHAGAALDAILEMPHPDSLPQMFTARQRRQLIQRVHELGPTEHAEIFRIIREYGVGHTQNNNGVFVNLSTVPDDILELVRKFVDFCISNKQDLDEYDKRLNECKLNQNYDAFLHRQEGGALAAEGEDDGEPCGACDTPCVDVAVPSAAHAPCPPRACEPCRAPAYYGGGGRGHGGGTMDVAALGVLRKQANNRFLQAKKRYAKRRVTNSAVPSDACAPVVGELAREPYLVT